MKYLQLIIWFFILTGAVIHAQDYRCIYPGDTAYFADEHLRITSIRVTEITSDSDSLQAYQLSPNIQNINLESDLSFCYSFEGASWMGPSYVFLAEGIHYFFPRDYFAHGNPFILRTNKQTGESWTCYKEPDGDSVTASILSADTMSFSGLNDSVLTIGLEGHFQKDEYLNVKMSEIEIIISKNYGLIKAVNFFYFPEIETMRPYEYLQQYKFRGSSRIENSFSNLTWQDVYDFEIGDVFHTCTDISQNLHNVPTIYRSFQDEIKKVISREITDTSVIYEFERKWRFEETWTHKPGKYNTGIDTITEKYFPDDSFNTLPGEPVVREDFLYSYHMAETNPPSKIRPAFSEFLSGTNDNCWTVIFTEGCFPKETYYKGLGGPYGACSGLFDGNIWLKRLVYYEKDGEAHGTPLLINVKIHDIQSSDSNFSIWPNPVRNEIIITNQSPVKECSFVLTSIEGKKVLFQDLFNEQNRLSLEHLKSGLYIYRINSDEGLVKTGKIIKE